MIQATPLYVFLQLRRDSISEVQERWAQVEGKRLQE